jgi:hypothetical protein
MTTRASGGSPLRPPVVPSGAASAVAHTAEAMAAFAEEVLATVTHQRPARTTARKRKARRGEKLKTLRVTYKIIMHPMAARSIVAHAA